MAITKVSITFVKLVPASNPPAETAFTPLDNVVLSLAPLLKSPKSVEFD